MIEIISLTGRIEEIPVVSTGIRWPTLRESKDASDFFSKFPVNIFCYEMSHLTVLTFSFEFNIPIPILY